MIDRGNSRPKTSVWVAAAVVLVIVSIAAYFIYAEHITLTHESMYRNPY